MEVSEQIKEREVQIQNILKEVETLLRSDNAKTIESHTFFEIKPGPTNLAYIEECYHTGRISMIIRINGGDKKQEFENLKSTL